MRKHRTDSLLLIAGFVTLVLGITNLVLGLTDGTAFNLIIGVSAILVSGFAIFTALERGW